MVICVICRLPQFCKSKFESPFFALYNKKKMDSNTYERWLDKGRDTMPTDFWFLRLLWKDKFTCACSSLGCSLASVNEACTSVAAFVPHVFAVYMSIRRKPMRSCLANDSFHDLRLTQMQRSMKEDAFYNDPGKNGFHSKAKHNEWGKESFKIAFERLQ